MHNSSRMGKTAYSKEIPLDIGKRISAVFGSIS
jgi:hypothetical protein